MGLVSPCPDRWINLAMIISDHKLWIIAYTGPSVMCDWWRSAFIFRLQQIVNDAISVIKTKEVIL